MNGHCSDTRTITIGNMGTMVGASRTPRGWSRAFLSGLLRAAALERSAWALVTCWRQRSAARAALARLAEDPRLLADIGVSRHDLLRQARKPFWRA